MQDLRTMLLEAGASLVGFADVREATEEAREGFPGAVSFAVALDRGIVQQIAGGPTPGYFGEYQRVNAKIDELGAAAAKWLQERGYRAMAVSASGSIDVKTLAARLPHKTVATRSGMGWIGKCALLVTEEYGSAIRLGSVLTDAPLAAGRPVEESRCGTCTACVDVCPGHAPKGEPWRKGMQRGEYYDAFACYRTARQKSADIGLKATICGMCIVACPWTKRYLEKVI